MIAPDRIGHVVLKVRNLERSIKFYTEIMGFKLMKQQLERPPRMAFFSSGRDHHEIAVMEIDKNAPSPSSDAVGLFHVAFRLRDEAHLRAAYKSLQELRVPIIRMTDHGITKSIYIEDPDGNPIEFYCDRVPDLWQRQDVAVPLVLEGEEAAAAR